MPTILHTNFGVSVNNMIVFSGQWAATLNSLVQLVCVFFPELNYNAVHLIVYKKG